MDALRRAVGRGVFPHQFAWLLDLPWRRFVLSRDQLIDRLLLCGSEVVLEVGAGSGYYSAALGEHVRRLVVSDLQREMLTKARQRLQITRLLTADYVAASAAALPFPDATFDRIVLVTVFGEIADQTQFLREAWRTLKPDGLLSISEHLPDPDFTSQRRLEALLSAAGFVVAPSFGAPWAYTANFRPRGAVRQEHAAATTGMPVRASVSYRLNRRDRGRDRVSLIRSLGPERGEHLLEQRLCSYRDNCIGASGAVVCLQSRFSFRCGRGNPHATLLA